MGLVWGSHFPPPPIHPIPRRCGAASVWGGAALWGAAPPASVVNWGGSWLIRAVNEAAGEAGRLPRVWDGPRPGQSDWEGLGGSGEFPKAHNPTAHNPKTHIPYPQTTSGPVNSPHSALKPPPNDLKSPHNDPKPPHNDPKSPHSAPKSPHNDPILTAPAQALL